jgi:aryl-alcohol dehydrogenase-like predicted oxidoreductase
MSPLIAGKPVSAVGLGCVTFGREIDEASSLVMMDAAVARGIALFDTAAAYGGGASERIVGGWLATRRPANVIQRLKRLEAVAARTGHSPAHLALAWAMHRHPVASVLVGGRTTAHLEQAFAAAKFNDPALFAELEGD